MPDEAFIIQTGEHSQSHRGITNVESRSADQAITDTIAVPEVCRVLPGLALAVRPARGGRDIPGQGRPQAALEAGGAAPYPQRARAGERRRSRLLFPARAAGRPRSRGVPS